MGTRVRILLGMAFMASLAPTSPAVGSLSLDDRVRHQRAIEDVYWRHRIWPKENPTPKPELSSVMTDEAIRGKIDDYLRKSNALEKIWEHRVTAVELQAELDRIVRDTRDGATLAEILQALGDDPYVIAETFVRHTLVDRLVRDWYANDARFHGALRARAESARQACASVACMNDMGGNYRETTYARTERSLDRTVRLEAREWAHERARFGSVGRIGGVEETRDAFVVTALAADGPDRFTTATVTWPKVPFDTWWTDQRLKLSAEVQPTAGTYAIGSILEACAADMWAPTYHGAPDPRSGHTAVWTGSEIIVWGTRDLYATGGRYNPTTDTWTPTSTGFNVPNPRYDHTAVWTGTEMLVWGGNNREPFEPEPSVLNDGARYNPASDTWTLIASSGAPSARTSHTAVWTGSVMVVWGGSGVGLKNDGGRYNPSLNSWVPVSTTGAPTARHLHTAVWTGSEMLVWGGDGGTIVNSGGRYDPVNDQWVATPLTGAPTVRRRHTAMWTGSEMIVYGGESSGGTLLNTGSRFSPTSNTWTAISLGPSARYGHSAVWTGSRMIVWGGYHSAGGGPPERTNSGGIYDPGGNSWIATSEGANAPLARQGHIAVWTGTEMIVWGGSGFLSSLDTPLNTGGRLNPVTNTWIPTSTGSFFPSARIGHTAVWTGSEMIVWGGQDALGPIDTGGRYNPVTNSWTPTTAGGLIPGARSNHSAVWSGTRMIVWGGSEAIAFVLYDPLTDTWQPSNTFDLGDLRSYQSAIWTGTEMIVWGGVDFTTSTFHGDGVRYNPVSDTSSPVSLSGAPGARAAHTAVWTGAEMIVWGGTVNLSGTGEVNTGGRYSPSTNSWIATPTATGVPSSRLLHSAVWTGSEMIVWGGAGSSVGSTGGRFRPSANSWFGVSTGANVPSPRDSASAVWTGDRMVVWGGQPPDEIDAVRFNSGGRYDPVTDIWLPTSAGAGVPAARSGHTAVWTGTQMIVWGGESPTATGGLYCASGGCSVDAECSDGDPCTDDVCNLDGTCSNPIAAAGTSCDDGLFCNGTDTCDVAGVCTHAGDPCTADCVDCSELNDSCVSSPTGVSCGDPSSTPCTGPDSCNGAGACLPNNAPNGTACLTACSCSDGVCTGPSLVDLTTGAPGTFNGGQSFNETRGVDVTLITGSGTQIVEALTLNGLSVGGASAMVGARIYSSSTPVLLASAQTTVSTGANQSVRVPITATLVEGALYRLAFFVSGTGVSAVLFDPDPPSVGGFPYAEPTFTFQINQAYSTSTDTFPTGTNIFVPRISVETYRPEINNGQDDQCAGQPGFGEIDELSGSMGFNIPSNKNTLSWPAQTGALSYEVARGDSGTFGQGCTIFGVSTNSLTDTNSPGASKAFFYLVRSSAPNVGSWGSASSGIESSVPCAP